MSHESIGKSDEWYTPKYIFEALGVRFSMDVAGDLENPFQSVPCDYASDNGLLEAWEGLVWMNPPFGKRDGLWLWVDRFINHGNGIALVPDRTSAQWWQHLAKHSESICFLSPKVKFINQKGEKGESPSNGITLHGIGGGADAVRSCGLGVVLEKKT